MPLFDETKLRLLARQHEVSTDQAGDRLARVSRLRQRRDEGTLGAHAAETRVEQSFNERLFCELFDYDSMFRTGAGEYHIEPKTYFHKSKRYDDFSLGFFSGKDPIVIASAELKPIGANLDAKQTGHYEGLTPVEQGFRAAKESGAKWIIVSNFDEIRLYSVGDDKQHESILLSELLSIRDFSRAYAILGRPTLLGRRGAPSPLDEIFSGASTMIVDNQVGRVRLVQETTLSPGEDFGFHELEDNLVGALEGGYYCWPLNLLNEGIHASVQGDRLVVDGGGKYGSYRLEIVRNGTIRLSAHIPSRPTSGDEHDVVFRFSDLALVVVEFCIFASRFYAKAVKHRASPFTIGFYGEIKEACGATCNISEQGIDNKYWGDYRCQGSNGPFFATVDGVLLKTTDVGSDSLDSIDKPQIISVALFMIRELLFSFERSSASHGDPSRYRPVDTQLYQYLKQNHVEWQDAPG